MDNGAKITFIIYSIFFIGKKKTEASRQQRFMYLHLLALEMIGCGHVCMCLYSMLCAQYIKSYLQCRGVNSKHSIEYIKQRAEIIIIMSKLLEKEREHSLAGFRLLLSNQMKKKARKKIGIRAKSIDYFIIYVFL